MRRKTKERRHKSPLMTHERVPVNAGNDLQEHSNNRETQRLRGDERFEVWRITWPWPFSQVICAKLGGVRKRDWEFEFADEAERLGIDIVAAVCNFCRIKMMYDW